MQRNPLTWPTLLLAGLLAVPAQARAEPLETVMHSFERRSGIYPMATLIQASDGNLYGTTPQGPYSGAHCGTIYRQSTAGEFTVVHKFIDAALGCAPEAGVIQARDGSLYGAAATGGAFGLGTLYRLSPDGRFTVLDAFDGSNGASPGFSLLQARDGLFYGATRSGGLFGSGALFRVGVDGRIDTFHSFSRPAGPNGPLMQAADGNLYGVTSASSVADPGFIYRVSPKEGFSVVYRFPALGSGGGYGPDGPLLQGADGALYGVTIQGGISGNPDSGLGTVFRLADGVVTILHRFTGPDGANPIGGVVADSAGRLFGVTRGGGPACCGVVYRLDPDGTLTVLHAFPSDHVDGQQPGAGVLIGSDENVYGTTTFGGEQSGGVFFRISGF